MTFALVVVPVVLLLIGFPIFLVLLSAVSVALVFFMNVPLTVLHQNLFGSVYSFTLLSIPFFIYAGELMGRGSVAQRLVNVVQEGMGATRGSLGVTTVGTSAIFGAISGVSSACVATIGKIMHPAMRAKGYPEHFSAGLVTAVGAIDIIIPPSVPLIIYGAAASESVPRLYAAGFVPGLLIAAMLVIILGGIYGGVFSPTEAAAVACVYAAFVTVVVYRELGWRDVLASAETTALFSAQILVVVSCASVFAWLLTVNQVPAAIVTWLDALQVPAWLLLVVINIILLIAGCFIDPISAILLLTPLLVPVVKAAGIDTVHFGIIMTVNLAIGLFSPPFGMNIFVAQSVLGLPLNQIYRGIVPFLIIYLLALILITFVPWLSLIGPKLLMG